MKEDFKNNTKHRAGRENDDSNKDCNSHIEININVAVGTFNKELIAEVIRSKTKDENFYLSVDLIGILDIDTCAIDKLDIIECAILKIGNKQRLLFECTNDYVHLFAGKHSILKQMLISAIMEKTATQLLLDNVLFTMLEAKLVEEFKIEKEKHENKKAKEISFDIIEYELVCNIDLLNQELSTIKNKLSENEDTTDIENLDKELHEKAMYAMGVSERFFNAQVEELKFEDENIKSSTNCEDDDVFEIVLKVKSPKCTGLDVMDIRNQFSMKYPELKDDIVFTKKIDAQGNIASILETKLKYDAMFILTNDYVNKENMIMSTIKDKEVVSNTEKEDFDRAIHNVRNLIVKESKK